MEFSYGTDAHQRLDVYPQKMLTNAPILIFIHGGGWAIGDRTHVDQLPEYARRHKMILASIDYRLVPEVTAKECAQDVAAAIAKVREVAAASGGDPNRIFVVGHSAGAHLAALVATDPGFLKPYGLEPSDLAGVVLLDGATYDLTDGTKARKKSGQSDPRITTIYAQAVGGQEAALSPALWVKPGLKYPPFLIFYVAQRADSGAQSEELATKLRAAGSQATIIPANDKIHATIKSGFGLDGDAVGERAATFFESIQR